MYFLSKFFLFNFKLIFSCFFFILSKFTPKYGSYVQASLFDILEIKIIDEDSDQSQYVWKYVTWVKILFLDSEANIRAVDRQSKDLGLNPSAVESVFFSTERLQIKNFKNSKVIESPKHKKYNEIWTKYFVWFLKVFSTYDFGPNFVVFFVFWGFDYFRILEIFHCAFLDVSRNPGSWWYEFEFRFKFKISNSLNFNFICIHLRYKSLKLSMRTPVGNVTYLIRD